MTATLGSLLAELQAGALIALVVFLRIAAAMALLPGFGERAVPARIKLALAVAFTAIVAPAAAEAVAAVTRSDGALLRCLATETLIGLALGVVLRMAVFALEIAGTIAAQSSSLSQLFGGGGEPMPAMSHLLVLGGIALSMLSGLHVEVAATLIRSYEVLPPGQFPSAEMVRSWSIAQVAHGFALGLSLAAPFVIAGLVYNLALGAINRAMPQLMVSFIGAPALSAGALALFAIATPFALIVWRDAFFLLLADPFGAPR